MIKAVTIDFWNTLVEPGNGLLRKQTRVQAVCAALVASHYPVSQEAVIRAIDGVYPVFERIWFEKQRTLRPSECVALIWDQLHIDMLESLHETVVRAFEQSILSDPPILLEGVREAVRGLADEYKLAVISDTSITPGFVLKELLERFDIASCFHCFVFSDETGVSKPHELAFRTALTALRADPSESVHIGDIERTDIIGAKSIGMKAILFRGIKNNIYQTENAATLADAQASDWRDATNIIAEWKSE